MAPSPTERGRGVGIADVAREAGVSITTVSHALSGRGQVAAATRERVQQVAAALGYIPNRLASGLRSKRSNILGFVADDIATTPFATRLILGAQDAAAERGQLLVVVNSNRDEAIESQQLVALRSAMVDGLIYARMFHQDTIALPDGVRDLPTVLLDTSDPDHAVPSIAPDEDQISRLATRTLIEAGHRRIAHLTVERPGRGHDGRIAGYLSEILEAGLEPIVVEAGQVGDSHSGRAAYAALRERHGEEVTGIFAFNDPLAMGIYQVAVREGRRIPDDLSLVSVDDFEPVADALLPGLTTVSLPHFEMGRWSVLTLLDLLDEVEVDTAPTLHPGTLITRGSVAPPRA